MNFEDFVIGMNKLGLKITHQGKMKDKKGISSSEYYGVMFQNDAVSVTVRVKFEDTNYLKGANLNLEGTEYGFKLSDFGCNSLDDVLTFLKDNKNVVNMDLDYDKITAQLNEIVNYDNVSLEYTEDGISYNGFISEDTISYLLSDYLGGYNDNNNLHKVFELYVAYILNEGRYNNTNSVEDNYDFLNEVRDYVKRANGVSYELEDILTDIDNSNETYESPEDVVMSLYDLPILSEDKYEQEVISETPKDLAKKIRKRLKKEFPNTKFSVKTAIDSGGVVRVEWLNYPYETEVEDIIKEYNSMYSKQTYGDYGNDKEVIGYIDPEDGLRYEGVSYLQVRQDTDGKYQELMNLITDYRLLNFNGLDEAEYLEHHNGNKRLIITSLLDEPLFYEIKSEEELDNLLEDYKEKFYIRYKNKVEDILSKQIKGYKLNLPKNKVRGTDLNNDIIELKVDISETRIVKDDVKSLEDMINGTQLFSAYKMRVKLEGEENKEKGKEYNLKPNRDGKDNLRVRRFVKLLNDLKIDSSVIDIPNNEGVSVVITTPNVYLTMNPMFVINIKFGGNKNELIYSKHREDDIKVLTYQIAKLCKENKMSKDEVVKIKKVLEAYITSNDLRKKV